MARNERYSPKDDHHYSLPVPNSTAAGTAVRIGTFSATNDANLNGVTETATGAAGEAGPGHATGHASVAIRGVFNLPISTTTAIAEGGPVYITSAGVLTPVATSNALFGHVIDRAKGTTDGESVPVRIKN